LQQIVIRTYEGPDTTKPATQKALGTRSPEKTS